MQINALSPLPPLPYKNTRLSNNVGFLLKEINEDNIQLLSSILHYKWTELHLKNGFMHQYIFILALDFPEGN